MSPSPIRDFPVSHISGAHHRRDAPPRPKDSIKPLLTHEPLPNDREKKPAARPQKKRKPVIPTKPVFTFDPKCGRIPSGRQDPPMSPPLSSRPSASESSTSTSSYDEQQMTPFADREIHDPFYDGYDAQKRPRIFSGCPPSSYPATACTDMNDISLVAPDFYDSPTSSSSPDLSDQSHCAAEFSASTVDYVHHWQVQPAVQMNPYGNQAYVPQPVVQQDTYSYSMNLCPDRPPQSLPVQYLEAAHSRAAPHGILTYPESNGYSYPPPHRY
ncbi:hypothetical protein J3R82DRAFT_10337 [Butyriboletus roseoflavus]|nr:hypothetical protein J3R82DRAFT_10337 [Butyriboletus roseoflavus]